MNNSLESFLSGAVTCGLLVVALFFARFWHRTRDRLLGIFSLSFILFAVERVFLLIIQSDDEVRTYVYLVRLVAFGLIILGIVEKNRETGR